MVTYVATSAESAYFCSSTLICSSVYIAHTVAMCVKRSLFIYIQFNLPPKVASPCNVQRANTISNKFMQYIRLAMLTLQSVTGLNDQSTLLF